MWKVTKFIGGVLLLVASGLPCFAEGPPFQLIYRQENIVSDEARTKSNLMINVINLSGMETRDISVSIPVPNPYLFIDSPVFIGTIPGNHQAEILHKAELPNDLIALSEPEENIVWRIEYTNDAGERASVEVKGVNGK